MFKVIRRPIIIIIIIKFKVNGQEANHKVSTRGKHTKYRNKATLIITIIIIIIIIIIN
jgi:hypothetical protein